MGQPWVPVYPVCLLGSLFAHVCSHVRVPVTECVCAHSQMEEGVYSRLSREGPCCPDTPVVEKQGSDTGF